MWPGGSRTRAPAKSNVLAPIYSRDSALTRGRHGEPRGVGQDSALRTG